VRVRRSGDDIGNVGVTSASEIGISTAESLGWAATLTNVISAIVARITLGRRIAVPFIPVALPTPLAMQCLFHGVQRMPQAAASRTPADRAPLGGIATPARETKVILRASIDPLVGTASPAAERSNAKESKQEARHGESPEYRMGIPLHVSAEKSPESRKSSQSAKSAGRMDKGEESRSSQRNAKIGRSRQTSQCG
jgi:hypothetical protein